MGAEENEIIKNNIKILTKLIDVPENKEFCFRALKDSIDAYKNNKEFNPQCKLIANMFMLDIIGNKYEDWFRPLDTTGEVEEFLAAGGKDWNMYLRKLIDTVGTDHYKDTLFYTKFRDGLRQMGLPTEDTTHEVPQDTESMPVYEDVPQEDNTYEDVAQEENTYGDDASEDTTEEMDFDEVIDDTPEEEEYPEEDILEKDIGMYVASVVERVKAVCETCFQLDNSLGMMVPGGICGVKLDNGALRNTLNKSDLVKDIYVVLVSCLKDRLICSNEKEITSEALADRKGYNYFPKAVVGYALGLVGKYKYNTWATFESAFREYLTSLFQEYADKGMLDYVNKLINALSTMIVVLMYEKGVGIRFRLSVPGNEFNSELFESKLKASPTFSNASIVINTMGKTRDTYDIQIMQDFEKYLKEPAWGYKALEAYMHNGKKPNIYSGLPIGRKLNGEIVEFKLDPSEKFLNFLAAGSGAGKGVLTLSILAACLGNGIPVFYVDCKPDMAEVFWNMADKYSVKTFAFDGARNEHPYGYMATQGIPDEVYEEFSGVATTLVYLKALEWALIVAKRRTITNNTSPELFFVFDESEVAQANVISVIDAINRVRNNPEHKPKSKGDEGSETYKYATKLASWICKLDTDLSDFIKATARKGAVLSLFIGQSTLADNWRSAKLNGQDISLFGQVLRAGTVFKFLGKGTSGPYGSDGAKITSQERMCINNYRFFLQAKGAKPGEGAEVFKTFLTLNSDNPDDTCWKKGIGNDIWRKSGENPELYHKNLARKYPGGKQWSNEYGMHKGTGFEGLASMYCDNNTQVIADALQLSWDYSNSVMEELGLNKTYDNVGEFLYDFSENGLFTVANAMDYDKYLESISSVNEEDEFSLGDDDILETDVVEMDKDEDFEVVEDDFDIAEDDTEIFDESTYEDPDAEDSIDEFDDFDIFNDTNDDMPEFDEPHSEDDVVSDSEMGDDIDSLSDIDLSVPWDGSDDMDFDTFGSITDDMPDYENEEDELNDTVDSEDDIPDYESGEDDIPDYENEEDDIPDYESGDIIDFGDTESDFGSPVDKFSNKDAKDKESSNLPATPDAMQFIGEMMKQQAQMYEQLMEKQQDAFKAMISELMDEVKELKKTRG